MLPRYIVKNDATDATCPATKSLAEALDQVLNLARFAGETELLVSLLPSKSDGLSDVKVQLKQSKQHLTIAVHRHVRQDAALENSRELNNPLRWLGRVGEDGWYRGKVALASDPAIDPTLPPKFKPRSILIVYVDLAAKGKVLASTIFTDAALLTTKATAGNSKRVITTNDVDLLKQHLDATTPFPELPSGRGAVYLYAAYTGRWAIAAKRYIN